jgi:DNA-binding NtrC family response regulator
LVGHILENLALDFNRPVSEISDAAMKLLEKQSWRGNVRELKNTLERAVVLADNNVLDLKEFGFATPQQEKILEAEFSGMTLSDALEKLERQMIVDALSRADGVKNRAAVRLGISRPNLVYRLKKLGLSTGAEE